MVSSEVSIATQSWQRVGRHSMLPPKVGAHLQCDLRFANHRGVSRTAGMRLSACDAAQNARDSGIVTALNLGGTMATESEGPEDEASKSSVGAVSHPTGIKTQGLGELPGDGNRPLRCVLPMCGHGQHAFEHISLLSDTMRCTQCMHVG